MENRVAMLGVKLNLGVVIGCRSGPPPPPSLRSPAQAGGRAAADWDGAGRRGGVWENPPARGGANGGKSFTDPNPRTVQPP